MYILKAMDTNMVETSHAETPRSAANLAVFAGHMNSIVEVNQHGKESGEDGGKLTMGGTRTVEVLLAQPIASRVDSWGETGSETPVTCRRMSNVGGGVRYGNVTWMTKCVRPTKELRKSSRRAKQNRTAAEEKQMSVGQD
ncbi:hypothetical protein FIBSPDRAFT_885316 [Athelia psychrophila]|uniref:Uncharacterized protein n=1 Tax=Athelia psychrophila TaxID=1759441 RepID=A0A166RZT1_9AGAM|nr:hypothetical protein FIBSPDRAFT_885316 [Fibularhizoctonia sp. CBS 109695]